MPDWSLIADGQRVENAGANTAASRGTSVTAANPANGKGSYAQLIASTAFDASLVLVMLDDLAAGVDYLIDLAIGGAGSEQVIAANLIATGGTGSISYGGQYWLPIAIPAGSRLAASCQATTLSQIIRVSCLLFGQGFAGWSPGNRVDTYGANTATSGGVSVDSGGTANTKGSYSQITASTNAPMTGLILAIGNQHNTVRSSQSWLLDVAIGGAGSEQIVLPNLAFNASTSPDIVTPQTYGPLPLSIPAGSRIAARSQSDGIDATDRLFDVVVYGFS